MDAETQAAYDKVYTKERKAAIDEQERLFPRRRFRECDQWQCASHVLPVTLPEICMDLRMSVNGSADPWPEDLMKEVLAMLRQRLESWRPPLPCDKVFDGAVRIMVASAISYAEADLAERVRI